MFRVITSSNRALAQRAVRSTLTFTRAESTKDPEAGSVSGGQDAFGKREKAEETRWARKFEAEQAKKYRNTHKQPSVDGSVEQRLAELEAQKRQIDQEIANLRNKKR